MPGGVVTRVPYDAAQVGYEPDGTPLSLERGPGGQAVLVEWRGRSRHTRAVVPGISPPRSRIATDSARRVIAGDQLTGVYPTQGQFATTQLRGPAAVGVVVVDSGSGESKAELTMARGELSYEDVWLDHHTLLIARAPYFVAWRPSTGKLFRVTDARSLRNNYWDISVASGTLAR